MGGRVSWLLNVGYERQSRVGEPGELRLIFVCWLATARTASDTLGSRANEGKEGYGLDESERQCEVKSTAEQLS